MAAVGGDCCAPQATAAGVKETEAVSALEKKLKAGPRLSQKETVEMAIATLQVNFCACLWVWRCGGVEVWRCGGKGQGGMGRDNLPPCSACCLFIVSFPAAARAGRGPEGR